MNQKLVEEVKEIGDRFGNIVEQLEDTHEKVFAMVGCPEEGISKELNTIRKEISSIIDKLYSTWGRVMKIRRERKLMDRRI